jgi:hypothetical protein
MQDVVMHGMPGGQTLLQAPQWLMLVTMLVQTPLQRS